MARTVLEPLGFKCVGRCFRRVVNDIYQTVDLQQYSDGRHYEVTFGIYPFCCEITELQIRQQTGGMFQVSKYAKMPSYGNKTDEDIVKCVTALADIFQKQMVPVLERAVSVISVYEEYEKLNNLMGSKDETVAWNAWNTDYKIAMLIKLGNYGLATEGLQWLIEHYKKVYLKNYEWAKEMQSQYTLDMSEKLSLEYKDYFDEKISRCEDIIRHLQTLDMDYINHLIEGNEQKSRAALESCRKMIGTYS